MVVVCVMVVVVMQVFPVLLLVVLVLQVLRVLMLVLLDRKFLLLPPLSPSVLEPNLNRNVGHEVQCIVGGSRDILTIVYLDARLRQVDPQGEFLSEEHVRVVSFVECPL